MRIRRFDRLNDLRSLSLSKGRPNKKSMNYLDIVIAVVLFIFGMKGYRKGYRNGRKDGNKV